MFDITHELLFFRDLIIYTQSKAFFKKRRIRHILRINLSFKNILEKIIRQITRRHNGLYGLYIMT